MGPHVALGESNSATATTEVTTTTGDGLIVQTTANVQNGVYGIDDTSSGGNGVAGSSNDGKGVTGYVASGGPGGLYGEAVRKRSRDTQKQR
jgi:hypothetical protein